MQCSTSSSSCSIMSQPTPSVTTSDYIQTKTQNWNNKINSPLTAFRWKIEFSISYFEERNQSFSKELNNLKVSLRSVNRSRTNAKVNADRTEPKLEISEKFTSDLFNKNTEITEQLDGNRSHFKLMCLKQTKLPSFKKESRCLQLCDQKLARIVEQKKQSHKRIKRG